MSFWSKVFGTGAKEAADAVVDTARGVSDIVERWLPSDAKSHEMYVDVQKLINENVAAARAAQQSEAGSSTFAQVLHAITDFVNHLMAPVLTVFVVGALFGWWQVAVTTIDPIILSWSEGVGAYWLGARAITRDIPSLIKMIVELRRAK